ncbi:uncharacterized protein PHACADRAFT_201704 [Phanerochaete carnosa HHB-10118-sp]|uniref:Uncharacterized protein n=1 Tax=Phanerochaete carnosa (strain HHB-10118-sp) TaxID=650164 RepID=K5UIU2_PHACS|nr:uncharacterized protein PHACADRAFT_201704 [Phanerochaete carnosa HHB-10118-sp]EKM49446.1 hypothetical protein PHACADRAFT_201704 [Phanerochaete carnosa HHB-10118-sp]
MFFKRLPGISPLLTLPRSASGDLLSEIESALKNAADCTSCQALLVLPQTLAHLGDDVFADTFVSICDGCTVRFCLSHELTDMMHPQLEELDVCQGILAKDGPILSYDLCQITVTGQTVTNLCDAVFNCSTGKLFQVIYASGVLINGLRTVGRLGGELHEAHICYRNFTDETGFPTEPAGPNGNSNCDSPVTSVNSVLEAARRIGSTARFTLSTGDVVERWTASLYSTASVDE